MGGKKSKRGSMIGSTDAAQKIGVEIHRLYSWEREGILKPEYIQHGIRKFRYYSKEDINRGRFIKVLMDDEGYTLQGAIKKLNEKK